MCGPARGVAEGPHMPASRDSIVEGRWPSVRESSLSARDGEAGSPWTAAGGTETASV